MSYIKTYNNWRNTSSFLLEGKVEDLIIKFPKLKQARDAGIVNHQYLNWMLKHSKLEPIRDIIGVVKAFNKNKQKLKVNGMSNDINQYKTPGELRRTLEGLGTSRSEESRRLKQEEANLLGTFGDWQVWLPITRGASCELGKSTTWCTAATQSDNLFNYYIMEDDVILYYVIKPGVSSIEDPTAKLSIGLKDGKPTLNDTNTATSVDAANGPLNATRLEGILGSQYKPIMSAIKSNYSSLPNGKHPLLTLASIAEDPNTPVETLVKLSKTVPEYVAGNPNTPVEILRELSNSKDMLTIENLAKNPNIPADVLKELIKEYSKRALDLEDALYLFGNNRDYDREEIESTAMILDSAISNPNLPASFIEEIFKIYPDHHRYVAQNPNTPIGILRELGKTSKSPRVQRSVAGNPNTPADILKELSQVKNEEIRRDVAGNPNTPAETLYQLSRDENELVRRNITKNPNAPADIVKAIENRIGEMNTNIRLAGNPSTSVDVLRELSQEDNIKIRKGIAKNPSTPADVLLELSRDNIEREKGSVFTVPFILIDVAEHPNTPAEALINLSKDPYDNIRYNVAKHPNTPIETLMELSKDKNEGVHHAVAGNPSTSVETLVKLSRDKQWRVRYAVAGNPSTPVDVLRELSNDENEKVRKNVA